MSRPFQIFKKLVQSFLNRFDSNFLQDLREILEVFCTTLGIVFQIFLNSQHTILVRNPIQIVFLCAELLWKRNLERLNIQFSSKQSQSIRDKEEMIFTKIRNQSKILQAIFIQRHHIHKQNRILIPRRLNHCTRIDIDMFCHLLLDLRQSLSNFLSLTIVHSQRRKSLLGLFWTPLTNHRKKISVNVGCFCVDFKIRLHTISLFIFRKRNIPSSLCLKDSQKFLCVKGFKKFSSKSCKKILRQDPENSLCE